jgi:hypothetical protein
MQINILHLDCMQVLNPNSHSQLKFYWFCNSRHNKIKRKSMPCFRPMFHKFLDVLNTLQLKPNIHTYHLGLLLVTRYLIYIPSLNTANFKPIMRSNQISINNRKITDSNSPPPDHFCIFKLYYKRNSLLVVSSSTYLCTDNISKIL